MTVEPTSTALPTFVTTLAEAAAAFRGSASSRPATSEVVNALLQAEKAAKQQRLNYSLESLLGRWRLCFVVATRKARQRGGIVLGRGFYVPKIVKAQISFNAQAPLSTQTPSPLQIGNQLQIGSLSLQLTGPAQYLGKKNLLAFDFTHMQLCLFGRALYSGNFRKGQAQAQDFYHQSIAKLPFFAFFLATEEFIAARGRGGGLAIWIKDK